MRRFSFVTALLLLFVSARLAGQEPWVDPQLRLLLRDRQPTVAAERAEPIQPAPRNRPGWIPTRPGVILRPGPGGAPDLALLVEIRNDRALAELRSLGARVGTVAGRVATVRIPVEALPELTRLTSLARIEAARPLQIHNNEANEASRVDEVRRKEGGAFLGSAGAGVVVGVVDTGIDYLHGDFLDERGVPRTLAILDQTRSGLVCDSVQIRARNCPSRDTQGHGTHVAGIAAGDGSGVGDLEELAYRYAGVAPVADIVAVKTTLGTDDVVDGVAWIFEQAEAMGKAAVVNISLGTQFGAHDGTSAFELGLNALTGPGRIIVTSAGNEGNAANTQPRLLNLLIHASAEPAPGRNQTASFQVSDYNASSNSCNDFALLDIWYGADQDVTFTMVPPGAGSPVSGSTGEEVVEDSGAGQVVISAPAEPVAANGDRNAAIEISGCGGASSPTTGRWQLRMSSEDPSTEPVHIWIAFSSFGSGGIAYGTNGFDNSYVVSIPATAENAISVGAYTSRICWPSPSGQVCTDDVFGFAQPVGDIAFFSSAGPTRDGRLKPEIAAPGMLLMSTRSSNVDVNTALLGPSRRHRVEMGTSMSAPHVTGAVALLLQHDPSLTPAEVREILTSTAYSDSFTGRDYSGSGNDQLPNPQWGYGKLDARAALETRVDAAEPIDLWVSESSDTLPVGATLPLRGIVFNAFGDSLSSPTSWTSSAPSVATVTSDGTVVPQSVGTAVITASAGPFSETVFIEVVPPATLVVMADPLAPPADRPTSRAGTSLALLDLDLAVDGFEGVLVDTLGFDVSGNDPAARLVLVEDVNDDGAIGLGEPVVADTVLSLEGAAERVLLTPTLVIPAQDSLNLVAGLELSGAVPNGAAFQIVFRPDLTSSEGLRSGERNRRQDPGTAVASNTTSTTLLEDDEEFTLSENPIRSDAGRLILSFSEEPTLASVYTLRGVRVADLLDRLDPSGVRLEWDLLTDDGGTVAPGIYFLIVRVGDRLIREKLIVARSFGGSNE